MLEEPRILLWEFEPFSCGFPMCVLYMKHNLKNAICVRCVLAPNQFQFSNLISIVFEWDESPKSILLNNMMTNNSFFVCVSVL